jgi:hypothetical protein
MARMQLSELCMPAQPLPVHKLAAVRNQMFGLLRASMADPHNSQADKVTLLAAAVVPLAQLLLASGTPRACVVEHAAELLECTFAADAAPGLALLFAE